MFIYPAIDLLNGRCVRLRQGDYSQSTVFSDDPAAVARQWANAGADRIHVVDLDGAKAGHPVNGAAVRAIASAVSVPVQLGGSIRTDADLAQVFEWGVRWAVLGTKALKDPEWVIATADKHANRIVLGVDAKNGFVATEGWLEVSSVRAVDLARRVSVAPLAAVVYTDIAKDGMMSGPNFEQLVEMRDAIDLPVIATGGVCTLEHVRRLVTERIPGCIIGRALYEGSLDLAATLALTRDARPDRRLL